MTKKVSKEITERWSELAKDCYKRKMICRGCNLIPRLESSQCKMKNTVMELYKKFGAPPNDSSLFFGVECDKQTTKVINCIKNGALTYKDITKSGGNTSYIAGLKMIAISRGMEIKNEKNFIKELNELLKNEPSIFTEFIIQEELIINDV